MIPTRPIETTHADSTDSVANVDSWIYSFFSSSTDAIIACDLNGTICAWNDGAQSIFGISAKQSLGKDLNRLSLGQTFLSTSSDTTRASIPADHALYPSTPDQIRALQHSCIKRVVTRTQKDGPHLFLESISALFKQKEGVDIHIISRDGDVNSHYSHSHISAVATVEAEPSRVLVGYSVILTDLSVLSTQMPALALSPLNCPQPPLSSPSIPPSSHPEVVSPLPLSSLPSVPLQPPTPRAVEFTLTSRPVDSSISPFTASVTAATSLAATAASMVSFSSPVFTSSSPSIPPYSPFSHATTEYMSSETGANEKEKTFITLDNSMVITGVVGTTPTRPTLSTREYSTDSGFDERSSATKPTNMTSGPVPVATALSADSTSNNDVMLMSMSQIHTSDRLHGS
ncbi:hypothetical protein BX616_000720, partial [Lobosporangium transversale]